MLSVGTVSLIVSGVGGTTTTMIVVSHKPLVASHWITHNVSLPTMSFAVYSIQPFGNTVASTTVPLTLVLPSHSVVVTKLPAPNGFGKHKVSTHVVQIVSTIVS